MPPGRPGQPWKGLDTSRGPRFLGYEQAERMLTALLGEAARWRPDVVVGIARGGTIPATMAATTLALPLAGMAYERAANRAVWLGTPLDGARILLVDDGCSTGRTMAGVRAALLAEGRTCLTLALVHDPDRADYVPDLSHSMHELWRFPWERAEATPRARAWRAEGNQPERLLAVEAPFVAIDLEVAILRSARGDPLARLPLFAPDRAVIVTARPEQERPSAAAWLVRWGYAQLGLECRPDGIAADAASLARHKSAVATRLGCSHVIEGDPDQAIRLAALAPHLVVTWWCATEDKGYVVGAASRG